MIDILDTRMISNNAIHGSGGGIWIHIYHYQMEFY